ncbi:MAG TPA: hypothetical protein DCS42_04345 [Nitrospiraceae bacterium]|nr:MAG: hypothetical protein A2X57_09605 [Nitrospirae bacterium GWD2_57_8]HAS53407.1 hypothetical protein [Nitrospiraceae bacterium]
MRFFMEILPFNACDYRCERCLETERCAVFRMGKERDERNFALGRETEGIEAALRDVKEIFAETTEMLLEKAEEMGIDLDEMDDTERRDPFEEAKQDPLYQQAYDFMIRTRAFLERAEPLITPAGQEFYEDVVWHHTIVPAKTFRAIGSDDEPEIRFDAVNSAAAAIKSLTICIMAFGELALRYPEISEECRGLSKTAADIKRALRERFTECSGRQFEADESRGSLDFPA